MKKNKKKTNNKPQKKSRYIKVAVVNAVNKRDFFECAWCCTKISEKHHIVEFHNDGENTVDNLILLCSNCHTEVHNKTGKINLEDLENRKSTSLKGDRITGSFPFELKTNKLKLGKTSVEGFENILCFGDVPVITLEFDEERSEYFLYCRLFNKVGDMIFWMSKNRYWSIASFIVISNPIEKSLTITNSKNANYYLKFWQEDGILNFIGKSYRNGDIFEIDENYINVSNSINISGTGSLKGGGKGTLINM